jgi:hypothetical protein
MTGSDAAFPELEVTYSSPGLLMGALGPVCLALWKGKPTPELFEVQRAGLAAAVAQRRGEALFLCVITTTSDPPDERERHASARMITSHGKDLAACACVIEGTGFRAAVTRTVLSGISLLVHSPAKLRFFDSAANACAWLETLARPGEVIGLSDQVELARARVDALAR